MPLPLFHTDSVLVSWSTSTCASEHGGGWEYIGGEAGLVNHAAVVPRTLMVSMVGSRCLLSEALTMISSKILYRPGTYVCGPIGREAMGGG